jgi:2,3-bisphosphoglycerate-dependent phosphoglycerate mutase
MSQLILIRHGQSTWNAQGRFTGWVDVPLSREGRDEARRAAAKLSPYRIDICFTSLLIRAIETAVICLTECEGTCGLKSPVLRHDADDSDWQGWDSYQGDPDREMPVYLCRALDERCYGSLQGLNKAKTVRDMGEETVRRWRRSYASRPPGGESLQDNAARTVPFFRSRILPNLQNGENALVAAHGNSLRSIVMTLDGLSEEEVPNLELSTGVPIVYQLDAEGRVMDKAILDDSVEDPVMAATGSA